MTGTMTWYNIVEGCNSFQAENRDDIRFYRKVLPVGPFFIKGTLLNSISKIPTMDYK
ncbi:MAG: hypothetical protein ACXAES_17120 [Promethearchaeota archaeon]